MFSVLFIYLRYFVSGKKKGLVSRVLRELRELLLVPIGSPYFFYTLGKLYKPSFSDVSSVLLSFVCPVKTFTLTELSEIGAHHSETRPVPAGPYSSVILQFIFHYCNVMYNYKCISEECSIGSLELRRYSDFVRKSTRNSK